VVQQERAALRRGQLLQALQQPLARAAPERQFVAAGG
jgi:hypothetical protein